MSEAAIPHTANRKTITGGVLSATGVFWFLVVLIGQWAFFYYIAAFYGITTFTGDFESWNKLSAVGRSPYVPGDTVGNLAYAGHALAAGIIAFGGALQLIPQIRKYAPAFHRWNGRIFLVTVVGLSLSGFYLVWIRQTSPGQVDGLGTSINGVLILSFAFLAVRAAIARDIDTHQRWAMRLYLVSNAQWFLRIGFFGYFIVSSVVGHQAGPGDPFLKFWTFGCFLVPLGMLELYFRTKAGAGPVGRLLTASVLLILTLIMMAGIFAFTMFTHALITGAPIEF